MKGLDLRKFRKMNADAKHTVMKHPDGHEIRISHSSLDPQTRSELHALPFADGGEVGASGSWNTPDTPSSLFAMSPEEQDAKMRQGAGFSGQDTGASGAWAESSPSSSSPSLQTANNMVLPQQQPQMAQPTMGNPTAGYDTMLSGIKEQANAEGALANKQAAIQQQSAQQMQSMANQAMQNAQLHDEETRKVVADMQAGHIDPDRYINNKGTAGKVSTAIGLILGGIGGGLTGQENPALKFLEQHIQNDIHAQEQDMGNKHNLLSALHQQYGDKQDALKMLNAIYLEKTATDLQTEALKSGNPLAQARAKQAMGPIMQQKAQILQSMGQTQAIKQALAAGQLDPAQAVPYLVPKEQRSKVYEALGKVSQLNKLEDDMKQSSEHLSGQFMNGVMHPHDSDSARQAFSGAIQRISEGRYNGEAADKIVKSLLPETTDVGEETRRNKAMRLQQFFEAFRAEHAPVLTGNGLPPPQRAPAVTPGNGPKRRR